MNQRLIRLLACPLCGNSVELKDSSEAAEAIVTARLECPSGHVYVVRGGVPRMTANGSASPSPVTEQIRRRFEFQWMKWGDEERLFGQTDEAMAARLTGAYTSDVLTPEFYRGKLVLDAGCGHGRYLRGFANLGSEVVGLDFGNGIDGAAARTAGVARVDCVQGDVAAPPFQPSVFDLVFCFGVIQFAADPHDVFRRLAALVRPRGYLYIWVYPKGGPIWEITQRAIRVMTTRLPDRALYGLCFLPVPLLSFAPTYSGTSLRNSSWRQCAQVVWDWYSPRYQWHFGKDEISSWFDEAGFEPPAFLPVRLGAIGRRRA